jgi:hypothetical protein
VVFEFQTHAKVGLTIILVGLAPLLYTTYRTGSHNWTPLSVSVDLKRREFRSPEFETDLTGGYVVSLAFDNGLDASKEYCLMGERDCGNGGRTLFLEWSVAGGAGSTSPAQYEPHAFSGSPGQAETEVGRFEAKRGELHRVVLNILADAGELNAAHPKLIVEAHSIYWEKWIILGQLALLCAIVLGAVGIGLIVIPILLRRNRPQSAAI